MMALQMIKPLFTPTSKKVTGLKVWCDDCGTNVDAICKKNGKPIKQCPHPERHSYKVYAHVPGTKNERRTLKLTTRSIEEAQQEAHKFRQLIREGKLDNETKNKPELKSSASLSVPNRISHIAAKHIAHLSGDAPEYEFSPLSKQHLADIERSYKIFLECLRDKGYGDISIKELNSEIVGVLYRYLLKEKKFSGRTFNKYMNNWQRLLSWYTEEFDIPVKNWFRKVERKAVGENRNTITREHFQALLKEDANAGGKYSDALRLLLFSGRRVNEALELKFNDVVIDEKGNAYMQAPDLKVSRIKGLTEIKRVYIPITNELKSLLSDLGYERHKGSNRFLIFPEVARSESRWLCDDLSKAFTRFYSKVSEDGLTLKSLRKTYITAAHKYTGGKAKLLSGHSNEAIIEKHYLDQKAIAVASQDFEVFPSEDFRENELQGIRTRGKQANLKQEVSK